LASSLIACNFKCNPRRDNKVLVPILFLIGVDVSYAGAQAHKIINVALHWEYSPGIVFIFSQGRKNRYHV
jgi:hypothetical protein